MILASFWKLLASFFNTFSASILRWLFGCHFFDFSSKMVAKTAPFGTRRPHQNLPKTHPLRDFYFLLVLGSILVIFLMVLAHFFTPFRRQCRLFLPVPCFKMVGFHGRYLKVLTVALQLQSILFASFSEGRFLIAFSSPFGSLWLPFWLPLAAFWLSLAPFWFPFGSRWFPFGSLLVPSGSLLLTLALDVFIFGVP